MPRCPIRAAVPEREMTVERDVLPKRDMTVELGVTSVVCSLRRDQAVWFAVTVTTVTDVEQGKCYEVDGHMTLFYIKTPRGACMPDLLTTCQAWAKRGEEWLNKRRRGTRPFEARLCVFRNLKTAKHSIIAHKDLKLETHKF